VGFVEDFQILTAAALHDVIEDCEVQIGDIQQSYGKRIAMIVNELTHRSEQSKIEYVEQLKQATQEAKMIKLADRWDNILDLRMFKKDLFGGRPHWSISLKQE